jgi:amino acid transporter/nucleotide-binding universal stress UspA family protein
MQSGRRGKDRLQSQSGFRATKVVVATTVMLSFITFWRAAAIVLCDLASSAFYVGGITEGFVGKSAPWFIFAIMLFSYAVRAVYIESCSMFVRGGVYRVVHEAMGPTLAKFSVSALLFDYVLTGPISAVSAGLYLAGLINEIADSLHHPAMHVHTQYFAAFFAAAATVYFWRKNIIGMRESSQKAMRIMQLTTLMVAILVVWCVVTILTRGYQPVPLPTPENIHFGPDALGWLKGSWLSSLTGVMILVGLGHSVLAMSGEETLAQVNREIASPKLKNLERAGFVIFIYSMVFTSLVSFFAVMLIPDSDRGNFLDNLIGGLAMHVVGPLALRLLFHGFVVVVGTIILAGAVNTAIIGSNGVLNRVAEDGVLPDWFRHPHTRFGTTHRFINLIVGLQLVTILLSRGDVALLGEAYAFGVVWSFAMKSLSVLVLRYKQPGGREWKVPLNFHWRGTEIPVGLGAITMALIFIAITNLLTKKVATISGLTFTVAFFVMFEISDHLNRRKRAAAGTQELEKFRLDAPEELTLDATNVRPGSVLVAVRNPNQLDHLKRVLAKTDTGKIDIVVATVKHSGAPDFGEHELSTDEVFSDDIAHLFSLVVTQAEKAGKHVELMVVTGRDPNLTLVEIAQRIGSSLVVMGWSGKMSAAEQAKSFGDAWETLPHPRPQLSLQLYDPATGKSLYFNLGPHPPRLWPQDLDLLHNLWLELSEKWLGPKLHHRDVIRIALRRLSHDLNSRHSDDVVKQLKSEIEESPTGGASVDEESPAE